MARLLTCIIWLIAATGPLPGEPGQPDATVYSLRELDRAPVLTKRVDPAYPKSLEAEKLSGKALAVFVVDANGNVAKIESLNASHPAFAEAARVALLQWKFKPGKKGSKPVACRVVQPMEFNP
jgi:TonB family protein